jgi:glycosyltransferase involved in cell wall biosynthesis
VSEVELRAAYSSSRALILLSDVEAFGLPILESLASGTPVLLGRLETTESLFHGFEGAHFCPPDDPEGTFAVADRLLDDWRSAVSRARGDRPALRAAFDWGRLADRKWESLKAAWARRNARDWRRVDAPLGAWTRVPAAR